MRCSMPKQFLEINNKPILLHTVQKMHQSLDNSEIILVLPKAEFKNWENICQKHKFNTSHKLVEGGNTRFESVKNGLKKIKESSVVAIHDGVRPLVNKNVVKQCMLIAKDKGSAVPVIKVDDSLRKKTLKGSISVNRNEFLIVQTPQCFKSEIILKAYQQDFKNKFTDDASVVEDLGLEIQLVEGNKENIKITTPEDLKKAKFYFEL
ncbi:MAG: 2-C-methyl-D-erythritol 4-phosphate cytidylyltransferase [Flavobacteriales bacterium]|nr:2-C-methyl-D-erythritol 4-phosphate cytidylyltransferase [Flavobacteriales bacterium]